MRIDHGRLTVDRKFHLGMLDYARALPCALTSVHPALQAGQAVMDAIQLPVEELPYGIVAIETDAAYVPLPSQGAILREQIARSDLVYGAGLGCERLARHLGIPYVMVLEWDLATAMAIARSEVDGVVHRAVRAVRAGLRHVASCLVDLKHARAVHCNGYPAYQAAARYNGRRLLYFDSRMGRELLVPCEMLASRATSRAARPFRLLYSGRYEPLKGAEDVVRAAAACLRSGLDLELHCYGLGSLRDRMQAAAGAFPGRIHIHEALPFAELVKRSYAFDLFVCCHIQGDPSCTYLEAFGAGLPIAGYANRMWAALCETSGAGRAVPLADPQALAAAIAELLLDAPRLDAMSQRARQFAAEHCFEREFAKRTQALAALLSEEPSTRG